MPRRLPEGNCLTAMKCSKSCAGSSQIADKQRKKRRLREVTSYFVVSKSPDGPALTVRPSVNFTVLALAVFDPSLA